MKKHQVVFGAISLIGLIVIGAACAQQPSQATEENWPQWRGPYQSGVSDAKNLPTTWSGSENIVWKTPLPAWSGGTPIIWGDKIFLTSPAKGTEESATPPPNHSASEEDGVDVGAVEDVPPAATNCCSSVSLGRTAKSSGSVNLTQGINCTARETIHRLRQ